MAHSLATSPTISSRVVGLAGILGGVVLLAALVIDIAPGLNNLRLVLFNVGAMAVAIGVYRLQAHAAQTMSLLGAVPALLANAWYLAMVVLAMGRLHPFAGDFGLVFFAAAVALWLTDAWFGFVTLRLGSVTRWGAVALAIGSILALTGVDRLELTSPANPTIFGPLSLVGIALNGIGWILLGLDVATHGRATTQPRRAPEAI
jgi:hypothetical protein